MLPRCAELRAGAVRHGLLQCPVRRKVGERKELSEEGGHAREGGSAGTLDRHAAIFPAQRCTSRLAPTFASLLHSETSPGTRTAAPDLAVERSTEWKVCCPLHKTAWSDSEMGRDLEVLIGRRLLHHLESLLIRRFAVSHPGTATAPPSSSPHASRGPVTMGSNG